MDVGQIRKAVVDAIAVDGLRVFSIARMEPQPPCVMVVPADPFIDYHEAMGKGLARVEFTLTVAVTWQDERAAQEQLDRYLSAGAGATKSVIDALEADKTLGLEGVSSIVRTASGYGVRTAESGASYLAADLALTVYTPRI